MPRRPNGLEVRIGFDRDTLYVGVICFDSRPDDIVSTQARRDGVLNETDSFEVLLDTYDDDQSGYLFATTPGGIEFDAQIIHGGQSRAGGGPAPRRFRGRHRVRRRPTGRGIRLQPELGCGLDGPDQHH